MLFAVTGTVLLVGAARSQVSAPQPSAQIATASPAATCRPAVRTPCPSRPTSRGASRLAASNPIRIDIASIGVHSAVHAVGRNPDGTIEVPPLGRDSWAGWYKYSPTPGRPGPAVIVGHVDSAEFGPAVFFELGALKPRDRIEVLRSDKSTAVFQVERVAAYSKNDFPTEAVYGSTAVPSLRLITCGGRFDTDAGSYDDNIVVFASLVSSRKG